MFDGIDGRLGAIGEVQLQEDAADGFDSLR